MCYVMGLILHPYRGFGNKLQNNTQCTNVNAVEYFSSRLGEINTV